MTSLYIALIIFGLVILLSALVAWDIWRYERARRRRWEKACLSFFEDADDEH